jgi:hypothetical protein
VRAEGEILSRRVAQALILLGVALVPWTLWLTWSLPTKHVADNWRIAWVGFDVALALVLLYTGVAGIRRSRTIEHSAMVAGTMLIVDAWFDVLTAGRGGLGAAIAEAAAAELPLAFVCFWIARDTERFFARTQRLTP